MAMFSHRLGELNTVSHSKTILSLILTVIETQHKNSFSEIQCVCHLWINFNFRSTLHCKKTSFTCPECKYKNDLKPFPAKVTL